MGVELVFPGNGGGAVTESGVIKFVIDGGGIVPTVGFKIGYVKMPFAGTITGATMLADQSGSAVVDVLKTTYTDFDAGATHPVVGDSITAAAKPTLASATKSQDTTLTGWTKTFSKDDIFEVKLDSVSTLTKIFLDLDFTKTGD